MTARWSSMQLPLDTCLQFIEASMQASGDADAQFVAGDGGPQAIAAREHSPECQQPGIEPALF